MESEEVLGLNPFLRRREGCVEPSSEVGDALNLDWRLSVGPSNLRCGPLTKENFKAGNWNRVDGRETLGEGRKDW